MTANDPKLLKNGGQVCELIDDAGKHHWYFQFSQLHLTFHILAFRDIQEFQQTMELLNIRR